MENTTFSTEKRRAEADVENGRESGACGKDSVERRGGGPKTIFSRTVKSVLPDADAIGAAETKEINVLRVVTLILLLAIAALASCGVYFYTANYENEKFEDTFRTDAQQIINSFHDAVERRLGAINFMADSITSHALSSGEQFPKVTLPNFEVLGSNMRVQADALIVHWMPLVTDENRLEWEEFAVANRTQIDEAFDEDARLRNNQDEEFGFTVDSNGRALQAQNNLTVLDDGTGYHPRIWSNGSVRPRGDEVEGGGPYLPLWQYR